MQIIVIIFLEHSKIKDLQQSSERIRSRKINTINNTIPSTCICDHWLENVMGKSQSQYKQKYEKHRISVFNTCAGSTMEETTNIY